MTSDLVYVAGPLFDEDERWWLERVEEVVAEAGYSTFLPHRDNPSKTADNVGEIFDNDRSALDNCSLVVASLNGITTDDGTAWGSDMPTPGVGASSTYTPTGARVSTTRW
jgi:nucleoside 2-deoxyribosyltransferase